MKFHLSALFFFVLLCSACGETPSSLPSDLPPPDMSSEWNTSEDLPTFDQDEEEDLTSEIDLDSPDLSDACTALLYYQDLDGDGFGNPSVSESFCEPPSDYVDNNLDCDDTDRQVNPDSVEICDGKLNQCGAVLDEGCDCVDGQQESCGTDIGVCQKGVRLCEGGQWTDCEGSLNPTVEICDGLDNDCDGQTDLPSCECVSGETRNCGSDTGACQFGTQSCEQGVWSECSGGIQPEDELCDGIDNDCDGTVDEEASNIKAWYFDSDGDGFGTLLSEVLSCEAPGASWVREDGDCDDSHAEVYPGNDPVCRSILDHDCNGVRDRDQLPSYTYYGDNDGDGYGSPSSPTRTCDSVAPAGYVTNDLDCWDFNAQRAPGLAEVCDGIDNDCNNVVDDNAVDATIYYPDQDQDGFLTQQGSGLYCPGDQPSQFYESNAQPFDVCPFDAEDVNGIDDNDGCPDSFQDADQDGIPNGSDQCPTTAEDLDGYQDQDGCPEADECDVTTQAPFTCQDQGFDSGTVECVNGQFSTANCGNLVCGDGVVSAGEDCDSGLANGTPCVPGYGQSCDYCSDTCVLVTVQGGTCGDGVIDVGHEVCEAGVNNACIDLNGDGIRQNGVECSPDPSNPSALISRGCDVTTCQAFDDPNHRRGGSKPEYWNCDDQNCFVQIDGNFIVEDNMDVETLTKYWEVTGTLIYRPTRDHLDLINTRVPSTVRYVGESLIVYGQGQGVATDYDLRTVDFEYFQNLKEVSIDLRLEGGSIQFGWQTYTGFRNVDYIGRNFLLRDVTFNTNTSQLMTIAPVFENIPYIGGKVSIYRNGKQYVANTGLCEDEALAVCAAHGKTGSDCEVYANWGTCPYPGP